MSTQTARIPSRADTGCASFLMLNESKIENEVERNEFSFIMKAVGDNLLHREWGIVCEYKIE